MIKIYDTNEIKNNANSKWVKVDDLVKFIDSRIEYLESNELYPAYGLNSQVESLKQLKGWFKNDLI